MKSCVAGAPRRSEEAATGCSDGGDDAADDEQPIATVGDTQIFEDDVASLAADDGFLAFIGAPVPGDDEDDLSQTEAGRRVLTWMISRAVVDAELAAQELEVDDSTVEEATEALRNDSLPEAADAIVDEVEEMGRDATRGDRGRARRLQDARPVAARDRPGRDRPPLRILAEHPEVADRVCGAAVAVDAAHAQAVRDHLAGGGILDGLDPTFRHWPGPLPAATA